MAPVHELQSPQLPDLGFSVSHQKVELDIDLSSRSLRGRTEITLSPHSKDLKSVRLNFRQCGLTRLSVNGKACSGLTYEDPYKRATLPWEAGAHQYHMLQQRMDGQFRRPPEQELTVVLPRSLKIEDLDPSSEEAQSILLLKSVGSSKDDGSANGLNSAQNGRTAVDQTSRFTPIQLSIDFVIKYIRDGMQFVGWEEGDLRYPHAYSTNSLSPGTACCLFPCIDSLNSRCTWEISIKCQKTVGDALGVDKSRSQVNGVNGTINGAGGNNNSSSTKSGLCDLNEEDKGLDLSVICTGDMTDEASRKLQPVNSAHLNRSMTLKILRRRRPPSFVPPIYLHSMSASLSGPLSMWT